METEQRKCKRLLPQDTVFAVFRPNFTKLGKIKDISRGGLSFEYVAAHEGEKRDLLEIDIFVPGDRFYLPRLPYKIIYDMKIVLEYQTFPDGMERRRCGLQFGDLTENQAAELDLFLKNGTRGTA